MSYTKEQRDGLRAQAAFLRGLAKTVDAYNATSSAKIDMGWLIADLKEAATECEQEAVA